MKEGIMPPNFYSCMLATYIYVHHTLSLPAATYTAGNIELGRYAGCAEPGWYFGYAEPEWCLVKDHDVHRSLQIITDVLRNYIGLQTQIKSMTKRRPVIGFLLWLLEVLLRPPITQAISFTCETKSRSLCSSEIRPHYSANGFLNQKNSIPHYFFHLSLLFAFFAAFYECSTVQEPTCKVSSNHFHECVYAFKISSGDYQNLETAKVFHYNLSF